VKKLTELAGFNTEKTCSNTWGVIKKKLGVAREMMLSISFHPCVVHFQWATWHDTPDQKETDDA